MKQLKLIKLELTNFKGIKHSELNAGGNDTAIFGDNETGKTTHFDGFLWLLFDKDSQNKTPENFGIKTLDNGKVVHSLNHEVEGTILVEGKDLTLKKVYAEKWTKKRGSATKDFTGHKTDHFIDGVPSTKKEYTEKVASVVKEDVFKLLTSPSFFNEQIHWKDRRDLLLEVSGDVTDEEVIASDDKLSKLTNTLNGRTIEDHQKVIAARRKEINQELEKIPVRINELYLGLPDLNGIDGDRVKKQIDELDKQIEAKREQINNIKNGSEINNKRKEISDIDLQISNVKNEHEQNGQTELFKLKTRLQEEQSNMTVLQSKIKNQERTKNMNIDYIKEMSVAMDKWRTEWKEINDQEFKHEGDCNCPTCGQELPSEQIEDAKEKALKQFNMNKSKQLENVAEKGVQAKEKVQTVELENEAITNEITRLSEQVEIKTAEVKKIESKTQNAESNVIPISENKTYNKLIQDKQAVEQQIESLQSSVAESVDKVQAEMQTMKEKQSGLSTELSSLNESERVKARIAELEAEQKKLSGELERLEEELYLTEEFTKTKVNLLTEKINNKFKYARFNLFKENLNGGIEEICETTYKGVPYSGGLNNAARINVGLDIINTLSKHYGVQAPIFIDNAEAVTRLFDTDTQIICLVVSESDKELRIENRLNEEVA